MIVYPLILEHSTQDLTLILLEHIRILITLELVQIPLKVVGGIMIGIQVLTVPLQVYPNKITGFIDVILVLTVMSILNMTAELLVMEVLIMKLL